MPVDPIDRSRSVGEAATFFIKAAVFAHVSVIFEPDIASISVIASIASNHCQYFGNRSYFGNSYQVVG